VRKFIISDLHGNGEVYDSIMAYLDNISLKEKVELFINGDLIDYGFQSFDMIMDVMDRMKGKGNVQIHYLGGNHELMMHQALKARG
jgi:UDP-2,3-diacylglucosamine pyrophosphatase LpxH